MKNDLPLDTNRVNFLSYHILRMDLDVLSFSLVPRIVCSSRSENLMGEEASAPPRKVATSRLCEVSRYFMSIFYLLLSCSGYVLVMMNLLF